MRASQELGWEKGEKSEVYYYYYCCCSSNTIPKQVAPIDSIWTGCCVTQLVQMQLL